MKDNKPMHPVIQDFFKLNKKQKKYVHMFMANKSLKVWEQQAILGNIPKKYQETVTGTFQKVDVRLPKDALKAVIKNNHSDVTARYLEPITAIQDQDLKFNEAIKYAYFTIYNTFQKYIEGREVDEWLIVNQSLASLRQEANVLSPLKVAINTANKL